jgi:hypothetical protein
MAIEREDGKDDEQPPLYRQEHRLHETYSGHNPVPTTSPLKRLRDNFDIKGKGKARADDSPKEVYDPCVACHEMCKCTASTA